MAFAVYILCAGTSLVCFGLLLRHYLRHRGSLLFFSALGFLCFAVANILLFVDLIVVPQNDLRFWRNLAHLVGVVLLLYGLIQRKEGEL